MLEKITRLIRDMILDALTRRILRDLADAPELSDDDWKQVDATLAQQLGIEAESGQS